MLLCQILHALYHTPSSRLHHTGLEKDFRMFAFVFLCFFFIIRDLLYFGDILIKINILTSYYNINNTYGTSGEDLGELPTNYFC